MSHPTLAFTKKAHTHFTRRAIPLPTHKSATKTIVKTNDAMGDLG